MVRMKRGLDGSSPIASRICYELRSFLDHARRGHRRSAFGLGNASAGGTENAQQFERFG